MTPTVHRTTLTSVAGFGKRLKTWSGRPGSNWRPPAPKAGTLPLRYAPALVIAFIADAGRSSDARPGPGGRACTANTSPGTRRRSAAGWSCSGSATPGYPMIWFPTSVGPLLPERGLRAGRRRRRPDRGRAAPDRLRGQRGRRELLREDAAPGRADPPARPVRPLPRRRGRAVRAEQGETGRPDRRRSAAPSARTTRPTSASGIRTSATRSSASPASTTSIPFSTATGTSSATSTARPPTSPTWTREWVGKLSRDGHLHRHRRDRQHPLRHDRHAADPRTRRGSATAAASGRLPTATTGRGGRSRSGHYVP